VLLVVIALLLASCNLINPSEQAPAYIEIEQFDYDPTPTLQEMGPSTSTKIKDVWVYVDNQFQGTYELPARFPLLKTGTSKLVLVPGIYLNGISSTRSPYPFYKGSDHEINVPENGTVQINPVTSYFDLVNCSYCESFEGTGFSLTPTSQSDTVIYQLPAGDPEIFEGAGSGVVYLQTADSKFEVTSTSDYDLPGAGAPVFLEFDYKINQEMEIGLIVNIPGAASIKVPVIIIRPSLTWNKIYIQLGNKVSSYGNNARFNVYFAGDKDPSVLKSIFYLDNIKVVNF
jgi:hypothetical protein